MRKFTFFLAMMVAMVTTSMAQTLEFTFNKVSASEATVTVTGNEVEAGGITATIASNQPWKALAANSQTFPNASIVCPDKNTNTMTAGNEGTITLTLNNVPEGYSFKNVTFTSVALNGGGEFQGDDANAQHVNFTLTKGETTLGVAENVKIKVNSNGGESVVLPFEVAEAYTAENGTLELKLTLSITEPKGCFYGLIKVAIDTEVAAVEPEPEPEPEPAGPVVITSVDQLSNSKLYTITSSDAGRGNFYALDSKVDMCAVTYNAGSDACHSVAYNAEDPKQQFAFVNYEDKFYLYSVSEKKFIAKDGNVNKLTAEAPFEFVVVESVSENTFSLMLNGTNYMTASPGWCANPSRGTCLQTTLTSQSENDGWDAGAWYTITEVGTFDATEALAMLAPAEPELPALEITGYTPTEAVEKLETITITFNDEIEGTFDMMAMSQIYLGSRSNGCSFAVEGNVLTITPFNAITTPGEYGLVIPEGLITRKANGEKISLNKEIVFEVKAPLAALEITGYTPTEAVESLETITITFNDEIEGTFDMMAMSQIYLGSRSNGCSFAVEGNVLTITPFNAITTPGEYGLVIPEGLITRKANGEKISMNKEITFTVAEPVVEPTPGIEAGKLYRIKASNGEYLTIGDSNANTHGHVHGATLDETNNNQVFTFIAVEGQENTYYVQSAAGKYFSYEGVGAGWNVNATDDATKAHALTFEAAEGELQYLIKCYNASKYGYKYFKYEYVSASGKSHPYNDADIEKAEVWTLEEVTVVEPEVDEATAALIATAKELIALEGIGYPAAAPRAELQAAIDAAEAAPTTEAGIVLQAAINAYYAATDVVLPENGKAYTFKAVYGNNKFYIYNNNGTLAVAACGDEELPESAKFICEYDSEDDFMFQFKTADGAYYLAYPSIGGKSWLDGESATGLEAESTQVTKFNINKILGGNNVAAQNSELLGLVKLDGWRGFHNTNLKDEFGPIVVKHSALAFDGASAPYYNENFTSAFCIEESEVVVTPLSVVAVTPNEAVETLHEITIEFDAEIAVDPVNINACTIDYLGWNVIIGTTASVEGNVLKLVAYSPIKDKGTHYLTIPAGVVTRASDGVAYEGGKFEFEVKEKAVEPLTVVKVTPEAEVRTLDVITIEFSHNVFVNAMGTAVATIANADNSVKVTFSPMDIKCEGNVVTFELGENAITVAGEYTLDIPSGIIARNDGVKYSGTHTFTVVAPAVPLTVVSQTPAADEEVEKLETITVTFNENIEVTGIEATDQFPIYSENSTWPAAMANWSVYGDVLTLNLGSTITEAGTYKLILPAEFFAGTESGAKMESDAVIYFTVNDTTGIEGVDAEGEQTIYDLTGRKIETITKGGIYIINGKKVVVK